MSSAATALPSSMVPSTSSSSLINTDVEEGAGGSRKNVTKVRPPRFLALCRCLNFLAGISALLCLVAHCMALATGRPLIESPEVARTQIIRLYNAGLAVVVILVETEWEWFLSYVKILDSWLCRGLLQGFLAMETLEVATSQGSSDFDLSLAMYRKISGVCLLIVAGLYCVGGVLCCGFIKRVTSRRQAELIKVQREMEQTERRKEELKSLLAAYNEE